MLSCNQFLQFFFRFIVQKPIPNGRTNERMDGQTAPNSKSRSLFEAGDKNGLRLDCDPENMPRSIPNLKILAVFFLEQRSEISRSTTLCDLESRSSPPESSLTIYLGIRNPSYISEYRMMMLFNTFN